MQGFWSRVFIRRQSRDEDVAQVVESMKPWDPFPVGHKPEMISAYNPSTQEMEAGASGFKGHPCLPKK